MQDHTETMRDLLNSKTLWAEFRIDNNIIVSVLYSGCWRLCAPVLDCLTSIDTFTAIHNPLPACRHLSNDLTRSITSSY